MELNSHGNEMYIIVAILKCVSKKKIDFWMQRSRDYVSLSVAIFNERNASEMVIVKQFFFQLFSWVIS